MSGVVRRFGSFTAVDHVDLDVQPGEIFALLGPSGCGKTTSLRMLAGLETLDEGTISMRGKILASSRKSTPPERRNIAMVFQSYAVWPHMTVEQNVAFPLKMRRVGRAERKRRVMEILEVTGLGHLAGRPANMLSGGQQQRVALARALVYAPDLLLLDEPLSNLDAKLRVQMRREIRRLNQELGTTMLFVTHDQDEALSLADRVAVMNAGKVEQVGTPSELYEQPKTEFVRDFLGRLVALGGVVDRSSGEAKVRLSETGALLADVDTTRVADAADGAEVGVFFRPEDVVVASAGSTGAGSACCVPAEVLASAYLGDRVEYVVEVGGAPAVIAGPRREIHQVGETLNLEFDGALAMVWPR